MSTGENGCGKRKVKKHEGLSSVCYSVYTNVFVRQYLSVVLCFKPPSHFVLRLLHPCPLTPPPPAPFIPITAAFPSDIDLGRVADDALQLNMPKALKKAHMRCGAMDPIV